MTSRDLALIGCVLAGLFLFSTVNARLTPSGEVWVQQFEPPYADHTIKLQLRVYDWWIGADEKAVVPKGTKYPILDDYCNWNPAKCPSWTLPSDIEIKFGPKSPQDSHRLNIFLTDTGTRVSVYSAPYETATPGCSGQAGSVCCGGNEYTLKRDEEQYKVVKMWVSRVNGTVTYAGNQPSNFRTYGAKVSVSTGYYTGSVVWDDMFFQRVGQPQSGSMGLQASMSFLSDTAKDVISDVGLYLTANYTLLLPVSDPKATGFVVPNDQINEQPAPLSMDMWRACRTSRCSSAPPNFCKGAQGPTPYASWRTTTTAKVIADGWNAAGYPNYKSCSVIGNGRKQFMNSDLTMGETHDAQFVNCTQTATSLVPVIMLPRAAIEAGNTAPPPPSPPPSPSPSPVPSPTKSPSPSPTPAASTQVAAAPPPPVPLDQANGPAISLVVTLPIYTPAQFNATGKAAFLSALKKSAYGADVTPYIRYRAITPAASSSGTTVDCVIYFAKADRLPAGLLITNLQEKPGEVFPQSDFGAVKVSRATSLGCVIPCGPNGAPGPVTYTDRPNVVACSCECDPGWSTQPNQNFDTWVYCMVKTTTNSTNNSTNSTASGGTGSGGSTGSDSVPKYPPPAPVQYQESSGGISAGAIVGILLGLFIVGILAYLGWRTGCRCCCAAYTSCFALFWHRCLPKKEEEDDIEAAVTKSSKKTAGGKGSKDEMKSKVAMKTEKKKEIPVEKPKKKVKKTQTQPTEDEEEPEEEVEQEESESEGESSASEASEEEEEDEEEKSDDDAKEKHTNPRSSKREESTSPKSNTSSTKKKKKKKKPNSSSGGNKNRKHKHKSNPFDN